MRFMERVTQQQHLRLNDFMLLVFHLSYMRIIHVMILLMRIILTEYLSSLETIVLLCSIKTNILQ